MKILEHPNIIELVALIDSFMLEIVVGVTLAFVSLFLFRSFRRSMLISQGQARFVVEHYDVKTDKIHKWLTILVVLFFLPILAYVKYSNYAP